MLLKLHARTSVRRTLTAILLCGALCLTLAANVVCQSGQKAGSKAPDKRGAGVAETASVTPTSAPADNKPKRRAIVVLDFDDLSLNLAVNKREMGRQIGTLLTTAMVKSGSYTIVERNRLNEVFKELGITSDERFDPGTAAKIGKQLGASAVVLGAITEYTTKTQRKGILITAKQVYSAKIGLAVRLVDVTTGEAFDAAKAEGVAKEESSADMLGRTKETDITEDLRTSLFTTAANQAIDRVVQNLAPLFEKLPDRFQPVAPPVKTTPGSGGKTLTATTTAVTPVAAPVTPVNTNVVGKVVKFDAATASGFAANLGRGIAVGQKLVIVEEIKDPDSGELLGYDTKGDVNILEIIEINGPLVKFKLVSGKTKAKDLVKIKAEH